MKISENLLKIVWFDSIRQNNRNKVEFLIRYGIDIEVRDSIYTGWTGLLWASDLEVIRILLRYGANVNIQDAQGVTPLIWACKNGNMEMVNIFLEYSADISLKDSEGMSALSWAKERENEEIIKLLESYSR